MKAAHAKEILEVEQGLLSPSDLGRTCELGSTVIVRGNDRHIGLGTGTTVKVNTLLGCSNLMHLDDEILKVAELCSVPYAPDMMMDLSIVRPIRPLYQTMIETFGGPVGTIPHYLCYKPDRGIDRGLLMEEVHRQAEAGVGWMTLHLTARRDLFEIASRVRRSPTTARGGAIVIRDMYLRDKHEGILAEVFDELMALFRRYGVVLAIGTVFRPANIFEALDEVHRKETELQGQFISAARNLGVDVIMEGVGHIPLDRISEYVAISKGRYNVPFMPLGPIVTDAAVGADHIANAIGASYMALLGGADAINSVTRQEHTGGVPSLDAVLEGVRAARVAAHSVNITRFEALRSLDSETIQSRIKHETCVVRGGLFGAPITNTAPGCSRCACQCPLRIGPEVAASTHEAHEPPGR
jgi:phosphomethylpyrimidine synthase